MIKKVYTGNNFFLKPSRARTLLFGISIGLTFAFCTMLIVTLFHQNVSIAYIFVLPLVMGAIPALFSTREQLRAYKDWLIIPWLVVILFFLLCFIPGFEGTICLIIIVGPFLIVGSIGGFLMRIWRLKRNGDKTPLYSFLLLPFIFLFFEILLPVKNQQNTVSTSIIINSDNKTLWNNIVNVRAIKKAEIKTHFINIIGIPQPLNGEIDRPGLNGIRSITWEKGIKFKENITAWNDGKGFSYNIVVDPRSIPPTTLDEHVMIGGRYFDVLRGGYVIVPITSHQYKVTLTCTYRITTNINFYGKLWADYILNDFNEMILEVIKGRSENLSRLSNKNWQKNNTFAGTGEKAGKKTGGN